MDNTLPGNADRYSLLNVPVADIQRVIEAAALLKLHWFCQSGRMDYVEFYLFFDRQGAQNYLRGLYEEEASDTD